MKFINKTVVDDRQIRTDWDTGFSEERRYGRGKSGGQVRDEHRDYQDPDRPKVDYDTGMRQDFAFDENTPRQERGGGHKRTRSDGDMGRHRGGDSGQKRHRAEENNRFRRERGSDDEAD